MRASPVLGLILAALVLGAAPASAKVLITVDKSAQQMNVSVDGVHRWTWPVSTGIPRYDTPSGSYRAFRMEADHFSKEWDDAPMPHSIFFTPKGHAIHGYLNTRNIGNPASHGCVRLNPAHAAQLFALVQQQGVLNTTVVLTGDVRVAMARRATQTAARNAGARSAAAGPARPPTELQPDSRRALSAPAATTAATDQPLLRLSTAAIRGAPAPRRIRPHLRQLPAAAARLSGAELLQCAGARPRRRAPNTIRRGATTTVSRNTSRTTAARRAARISVRRLLTASSLNGRVDAPFLFDAHRASAAARTSSPHISRERRHAPPVSRTGSNARRET